MGGDGRLVAPTRLRKEEARRDAVDDDDDDDDDDEEEEEDGCVLLPGGPWLARVTMAARCFERSSWRSRARNSA